MFEDMVHEDDEFSHNGGKSDFGGFAGLSQTPIEGVQDGIGSGGGQSGHVKGTTQGRASPSDGTAALPFSALPWVGCDAGQGSGLSAIERAQFGQFGQDTQGGGGTDAGDRFQALETFLQNRGLFAQLAQEGLDLSQITFQSADQALRLAAQSRDLQTISLLALSDQQFEQLDSSTDQFGQVLIQRRAGHGGLRPQRHAVVGKHSGIDPVGLGALALSPGEMAKAGRVKDAQGNSCLMQCGDHLSFIATGGFTDDLDCRVRCQQFEQLAVAGSGIRQVVETTGQMELEVRLGDIQASVDNSRSVRAHSCKYELAAVGRSINGSSCGHVTQEALAPGAFSSKLMPEGNELIRADALRPAGRRVSPFSSLADAKQERWKADIQEGTVAGALSWRSDPRPSGERFSLSPRERAGVRGKDPFGCTTRSSWTWCTGTARRAAGL